MGSRDFARFYQLETEEIFCNQLEIGGFLDVRRGDDLLDYITCGVATFHTSQNGVAAQKV